MKTLLVLTLGACAIALSMTSVGLAQTSSLGTSVVNYLQTKDGQRIGGGNSADLATEALRIAGAEFVADDLGADAPAAGDRVWGTLVAVIASSSDLQSTRNFLPGDILQLSNASLNEKTCPTKFTAVVAEIEDDGRLKTIFCQEYEGNRTVKKLCVDLSQFSSGWMRVYRPKTRVDRADEWKVTVVNNTTASQGYHVYMGIEVSAVVQSTAANTSGSYYVHRIPTDGTVPNLYTSGGRSYFLEHGKAYELYTSTNGVAIRQLAQ